MKKSGFALSKVTTFKDSSASISSTRSKTSSYMLSSIALIGGLFNVIRQYPSVVLSTVIFLRISVMIFVFNEVKLQSLWIPSNQSRLLYIVQYFRPMYLVGV